MYKENTDTLHRLIPMTKKHPVIAFHGAMGAGKTTFIKKLCRELGVEETVSSPTFSIINEYRIETTGETIFHFDFYRINNRKEAENLGVEEYFFSGKLCLIEWPEIIEDYLPDNTLHVFIHEKNDGSRTFKINE